MGYLRSLELPAARATFAQAAARAAVAVHGLAGATRYPPLALEAAINTGEILLLAVAVVGVPLRSQHIQQQTRVAYMVCILKSD